MDCVLSYCHYSLNDTSLREFLPLLATNGIGIINAAALSMGLLTDQGPPAWHPATADIQLTCKRAVEFCRKRGENIAELALEFALTQPDIHTTLVGMASVDELQRNLKSVGKIPDPVLLAQVQEILAPIQNKSWSIPGQLILDEDPPVE